MDKEFLELQKKFERLLKNKQRGIVKNYAKSYKQLKEELEKLYEKYEINGQVTMDSLRKYNRLKSLDEDTAEIMWELYRYNKKLIKNSLGEIIDKTWEGALEALGASGEVPTVKRSFNTDELVHQAVAGRVWTERINHYGNNFIYDVHTIIRKGIEDGETFTTMAKNLKTRYGEDIGNTVRIARTEGARVQAYTADKVMSEVNKEQKLLKTWRTMKDKAVRHTHTLMEGKTVKFDEEFILPSGARCMYPKGTGVAAEDINCRCYVEYKRDKGYNEDEPIEVQSDEAIRSWIKDHDKRLNHEKYEEHNPNSKRFKKDKSIIYPTERETQRLIRKNAGTGYLKRYPNGKWMKKEFFNNEEPIGEIRGKQTETYSIDYQNEKWVHVIPRKRGGKYDRYKNNGKS